MLQSCFTTQPPGLSALPRGRGLILHHVYKEKWALKWGTGWHRWVEVLMESFWGEERLEPVLSMPRLSRQRRGDHQRQIGYTEAVLPPSGSPNSPSPWQKCSSTFPQVQWRLYRNWGEGPSVSLQDNSDSSSLGLGTESASFRTQSSLCRAWGLCRAPVEYESPVRTERMIFLGRSGKTSAPGSQAVTPASVILPTLGDHEEKAN